jgi:hypothetical protein
MVIKKNVKRVPEGKTTRAGNADKTEKRLMTRKIPLNQGTVQGNVQNSDGSPRSGLTIRAFDRNIGAEDILLGEAVTDNQGHYSITYPFKKLGSKSAADLVLMVYSDKKLLEQSDIIFNAGVNVTKDFFLPVPAVPEFQRLSDAIIPLLHKKNGFLEKDQITFLTKKTGIGIQKIEHLLEAEKLSNNNEILSAFYYGLLSENYPTDPVILLALDRTRIIRALRRAESRNVIPLLKKKDIDHIFDTDLPKIPARKHHNP